MPKVPGTFRRKPGALVVAQRQEAASLITSMGALYARAYMLGECGVLIAREPYGDEFRWHLSISHQSRYPTWDEIKTARYLAEELKDVKLMAQLLPKLDADEEWVDVHPNTMHLHEVIDR